MTDGFEDQRATGSLSASSFHDMLDSKVLVTCLAYPPNPSFPSVGLLLWWNPSRVAQETTLQSIVDAKAAAAQDAKTKKKQEADKTAANTVVGRQAIAQGNARCGPGARATSFEDARAQDDHQYDNLRRGGGGAAEAAATGMTAGGSGSCTTPTMSSPRGQGGAAGAAAAAGAAGNDMTAGGSGGRNSPAMSSSSGRSSPAPEWVMVPGLGAKLVEKLGAHTAPELVRDTAATLVQAELFLDKGFTYDQIDRTLAVELLTMVLERHHSHHMLDWKTVEEVLADAKAEAELSDEEEREPYKVPGITVDAMYKVQMHYGTEAGGGGNKRNWYATGWPERENPTTAKFENEARLLAEDCLPSGVLPAAEGPVGGAGACPSSGGPSKRTAGVEGEGNRGRKTRQSKNKAAEDGVDG